jgi:glycosyltransferase involved in cell wall biosynthesis
MRAAGVEVDVVSPASFPHFGIAFGGGIAQNLRAAPWRVAFVPPFMAAFALAARRAARSVDVVHAHWIPSALAARATGKPYVLQVWGTDVELARRMPALARPVLRDAELVIAASHHLAAEAQALGARAVRIVAPGVPIPAHVAPPEQPPHVLYAGRLSEEKGILEFAAATAGLPRVIAGDGPLLSRVPDALGFVPPAEIGGYYTRATVVCVPSRREGYGFTAREAMAYGRHVVATRVGGLADLEGPGVTLVEPGDIGALRGAIEAGLAAPSDAGRSRAQAEFSDSTSVSALVDAYEATLSRARARR